MNRRALHFKILVLNHYQVTGRLQYLDTNLNAFLIYWLALASQGLKTKTKTILLTLIYVLVRQYLFQLN